jgi:hypothetical protein
MNRAVVLALALLASPVAAHHSFAMFDQRQIMTLEGTVTEFQWTNPHAFIELDAEGGRHWSIELNSPNNLKRQGWSRAALKPGDKVTLRMSPFLVDYHVRTQEQSEIVGGRWNVEQFHYTVGTLMVALVDPKTSLDLWQGNAQGVVDSAGQPTPDIKTSVQKMFADFPS